MFLLLENQTKMFLLLLARLKKILEGSGPLPRKAVHPWVRAFVYCAEVQKFQILKEKGGGEKEISSIIDMFSPKVQTPQ